MLQQLPILQLILRQQLPSKVDFKAWRFVSSTVIDEANEELNALFAPGGNNTSSTGTVQHSADLNQLRKEEYFQQEASNEHNEEAVRLTHVDAATGKANMVDVVQKQDTVRTATATGSVLVGPTVFQLLQKNQMSKGDVLTTAQIAGIQAAKHTHSLIPLCHQLLLSKVDVQLQLVPPDTVHISGTAVTRGPTGVEMEALTAVSVAALTVYDMCKAASKDMVIQRIQLQEKHGGKSGSYVRDSSGQQ